MKNRLNGNSCSPNVYEVPASVMERKLLKERAKSSFIYIGNELNSRLYIVAESSLVRTYVYRIDFAPQSSILKKM